jgi:Tfp pilus assembly protein PilN
MRIDLNLAREPFRNRSLFWLATTAGYLVAFVALMVVIARAADVGASTVELRAEIVDQEKTIAELEDRIESIADERGRAVFQSEDREALDDARYLVIRRSFSWSRLLNDLETHVPSAARLESIEITELTGEGENLTVEMTVSGFSKTYAEMGELIASLDKTAGRFNAEPRKIEPDELDGEFAFEITVQYRPSLAPAGATAAAPAPPPAEEEDDDV